jgi:hypothetical protein
MGMVCPETDLVLSETRKIDSAAMSPYGLVDEHCGRWPPDAQARLMGMSTSEWARYLSEDLGVGLPPDRVAAVVIGRMAACYAERLPLMPGADGALRRLGARC